MPYNTQADAPTQLDPAALNEQAPGGEGEDDDADFDERLEDEPPADGNARDPVLRFENLKSENEFFQEGFGIDGAHFLKAPAEDLLIEDRRFMQKMFLSGKSTITVKAAGDLKINASCTRGKNDRKRCSHMCLMKLFKGFAEQFPRLAIYDGQSTLQLRNFPQDEEAQDKMHNDCMTAVRLTLKSVSDARVKWMSSAAVKRERQEVAPEDAGEAAHGPRAPLRPRIGRADVRPAHAMGMPVGRLGP